ncbi:MAG: UvrD-helicase domain-containing protein [Berryella intestinalis]|nr:UvrD-helicase domain-containing protein [Berryella intestinalis]
MGLMPGQRECVDTLDRPVAVAAGAGSGKTFTLTKRIAHAVESGFVGGIDEVLAITFTTKAAGELKARIKNELRAIGRIDQALLVDDAWISTIHGMCSRLLRAHAVELGIDPCFSMADEPLVARLRGEALEGALRRAEDRFGSEAMGTLHDEYGAGDGGVAALASELTGMALASEGGVSSLVARTPQLSVHQAIAYLGECAASVAEVWTRLPETDKRIAPKLATLEAAKRLEDLSCEPEPSLVEALSIARYVVRVPGNCGAKFKESAQRADADFAYAVQTARLLHAAGSLSTLIAIAEDACASFQRAKAELGVLDNDDLLVMAHRALVERPEIAARYEDRFKLVMIDEFQDTDRMQVDMIKRLAGPGARRLCTVGDWQQSIYRFRGADVSVYRDHLEKVGTEGEGKVIELADNFRSHADVLAFVDRVFEQPQVFGGRFMSLKPGRDESRVDRALPAGVPRVAVDLFSTQARVTHGTDVAARLRARRIAGRFAAYREAGCAASDMVVLLGRMTKASVYADELRALGFNCVVAGGSVFSSSLEALEVASLLDVLADEYDTQALYRVLTGTMFEVSTADLLYLGTARYEGELRPRGIDRGLSDLVRGAEPEGAVVSERLENARYVLGAARSILGAHGVAQAVRFAFVESGLASRLQQRGGEGLASAGNMYKAIRIVEGLEASGAGAAEVAGLYRATIEGSRLSPGALSARVGDFVRIMTVHASKGLEFPIVAISEMDEKRRPPSPLRSVKLDGRVYLSLLAKDDRLAAPYAADLAAASCDFFDADDDEGRLARLVTEGDDAVAACEAMVRLNDIGETEESKRLLYVGITRAKEAVILSMRGARTKERPEGSPGAGDPMSAVVPALAGPGGFFDQGATMLSYRGSQPAVVVHQSVPEKEVALDEIFPPRDAGGIDSAEDAFIVPVHKPFKLPSYGTFEPVRSGFFSYSSLAHGAADAVSDAIDAAVRYAVSVDGCESAAGGMADIADRDRLADGDGEAERRARCGLSWSEGFLESEDDRAGFSVSDSDKATDLGSAFHLLAQYAVDTRGEGGVEPPSPERVGICADRFGLDRTETARIEAALERWARSDVAREIEAFGRVRSEVPFACPLDLADGSRAILEGAIDLLAEDAASGRALIVDYKTGGRADEAPDALSRKHALQALCYAFVVLGQGYSEVEAVFVRVEQPREGAPDAPQCVRYRFTRDDAADLEGVVRGLIEQTSV